MAGEWRASLIYPVRGRAALAFAALSLNIAAVSMAQGAGARLFKSGPIQITADGQTVWCANQDNDSVTRIDTTTLVASEFVLPEPGLKDSPKGLSLMEDGSEVWVACHDSDRVYVLDGSTGQALATIHLPWGSGAYSVALSRDQSTALVTLHRASSVAVIDVATRTVTHVLEDLFWSPMGIAFTEDGASAWVNHLFAPGEHPPQTRIDLSGPEPVAGSAIVLFRSNPVSSPAGEIPEGGYLTVRGHGAQIPSVSGANELWLPVQYNNIGMSLVSSGSTVQSVIRRLDLDTNSPLATNADKVILTAVDVHDPVASGNPRVGDGWDAGVSGPIDIAFSADGSMAYLLHELSNDLVVMPSNTPATKPAGASPLPEIVVGDRPMGMAVSPVDERIFVYNLLSRDVSVVDLITLTETARVAVNPVSSETFSAPFLTGAKLFHTSADPQVSGNAKVSCASCHINAEHDGRNWAFGNLPGLHGPRESTSLLGLGATFGPVNAAFGWGQLHRSGDRDEVQDFEHTFRGPQMGGTGFLGAGVQPELGAPNAGRNADLDAVAHYLLNLPPVMRSPYRAGDGSLTEAARRGATFFVGDDRTNRIADANCASCHVPETAFVDFGFHDVGQRRPSAEQELNSRSPAWHVNTPTLVGVWTSPFYNGIASGGETHLVDEAMETLVLDLASRAGTATPHGSPDGLTGRQIADLAEFVLSVDGNMSATEVRNARDTAAPRIERVAATSLTRVEVWFNESVDTVSAQNPAHYALRKGSEPVAITSAVLDPQNGDRVTLTTMLQPQARFTLEPAGPILDLADRASNGTANAIDTADTRNRHVLDLFDRLTITMGASGYENLTIPVNDAAMVGSGLQTWNHDQVRLFNESNNKRRLGFVRFDWKNPFQQECGITDSNRILGARLLLHGDVGDAQTVEMRRVLQPWSDASSGGNWNRTANGAPTWRDHSHSIARWNTAGARALGGIGSSVSDYNAAFDLAGVVDASVVMERIIGPSAFDGPKVTEAFRFWFDNPGVDYGYALRLAANSSQEVRFYRWEAGLRRHGPVLELTYSLGPYAEVSGITRTGNAVAVEFEVRNGTLGNFNLQKSATMSAASWVVDHGASITLDADGPGRHRFDTTVTPGEPVMHFRVGYGP